MISHHPRAPHDVPTYGEAADVLNGLQWSLPTVQYQESIVAIWRADETPRKTTEFGIAIVRYVVPDAVQTASIKRRAVRADHFETVYRIPQTNIFLDIRPHQADLQIPPRTMIHSNVDSVLDHASRKLQRLRNYYGGLDTGVSEDFISSKFGLDLEFRLHAGSGGGWLNRKEAILVLHGVKESLRLVRHQESSIRVFRRNIKENHTRIGTVEIRVMSNEVLRLNSRAAEEDKEGLPQICRHHGIGDWGSHV